MGDKPRFGYGMCGAGAGVNKRQTIAGLCNNSHMPHAPNFAVRAGKENNIARAGVGKLDSGSFVCKVNRAAGNFNLKMVEHIHHKT